MSALGALRFDALCALQGIGFLRRDRTAAALFVTDHPARAADPRRALERLTDAGFCAKDQNGLWALDLTRARWEALIGALPRPPLPEPTKDELALWALAKRLTRAPVPAAEQPLAPIRLTLLRLDAHETARLAAELPPLLSECLRLQMKPPEAAGWLIADALCADRSTKKKARA